jgi:hypothetical protein
MAMKISKRGSGLDRIEGNPPDEEEACTKRSDSPRDVTPNVKVVTPFSAAAGKPAPPSRLLEPFLGDAAPPFTQQAPYWVCLRKACLKVRAESFELPKTNSVANFAHDVKVKVQVVVGVQDRCQEFSSGI